MSCACPADWILCLSKDCPRAKFYHELLQKRHEETMKFLGDPRESITIHSISELDLLVKNIHDPS